MEKGKKSISLELSEKDKKVYVSPTVEVTYVEIEQGIAAGSASATVNIGNADSPNKSPNDEWQTEDQPGGLDW